MIIPGYCPTYSFESLATSLHMSLAGNPRDSLRRKISQLYAMKHVFLLCKARTAFHVLLKAYNRPGDVIGLPTYLCLSDEYAEYICTAVKEYLSGMN